MPNIDTRIARLRQAMRRRGLSAYIVPSSDLHLSEYLPARWQGRRSLFERLAPPMRGQALA